MMGKNKTEEKIDLLINNITVEEARIIMDTVRSIERKDSDRLIFCQVKGLEDRPMREAVKIINRIFPGKTPAG